ncbi:MAG: right-handed parallel beta-helix repeat-containing protein [Ardenticatenales bacterium]|nr:right-handed parallel beta-helix repeat-containing protein [Ardenticatenales bacterium]
MASGRSAAGFVLVGLAALVLHRSGAAWTASVSVSAQATGRAYAYLPLAMDSVPMSQLPAAPSAPPTRAPATVPPTTPAPTATALDPSPTVGPTEVVPSATPTPLVAAACGTVPSFHDGRAPSRIIRVAPGGDDGTGDGSAERPFATLRRAAREAAPGSAIRLAPGRYDGGTYLDDLAGAADAPIWIGGAPGTGPGAGGEPWAEAPIIAGSGEGLHLTRARFVVVHDVVVEGASGNGINADDGGSVTGDRTSFRLTFERVAIRNIGGNGNQDCLKLSGLRDVVVRDSAFRRCGGGGSGSGIDMVGVQAAVVARSRFDEISGNAVQAKGGSNDIEVRANRMVRAGGRAVNMGGSTGFAFFRPPLDASRPNAEARDVRVVANWIEGSEAAVAFVGCVDCLAAHNTIVDPGRWVLRILQETRSSGGFTFEPAREGTFANNIVVFRAGVLRTAVNVGDATAPETFAFRNNLWFASDAPERSAPQLPVAEQGAVIGRDPRLGEDGAIGSGSPAAGAGSRIVGVTGDLVGACYGNPPSIGAREVP